MKLGDLFGPSDLDVALREGLVRGRPHPSFPLTIYNYTERCQYESGLWNPVTLTCRGLIVSDDGLVVARPFRKFFNWGQAEGVQAAPDSPVEAVDKLDGSLGILYPTPDGSFAIATRGAFESEQAIHATDIWDTRYANTMVPDGWTLLFEIVYPENRIVIDYRGIDDLFLLGAVEVATGRHVGPTDPILADWGGPRAEVFNHPTLGDALAAAPRRNAEGMVLRFADGGMVKVKQEDYVALHRIVTGLNEVTIWEFLSSGNGIGDLLANLPDEFHGWCRDVADRMVDAVRATNADIDAAFDAIQSAAPADRRTFAELAKATRYPWAMFSRLDGRDYADKVWKLARPSSPVGPRRVDPEAS